MPHRYSIFSCALLGLLSGCAVYHTKPITPTRLASKFDHRSLNSDGLRAYLTRELGRAWGSWPPPRWNRRMLTLAAYYYNPALDVARAQWGTAKSGVDAAGTHLNPILQLPLQYSTPNPGPGAPYTVGPALDIPIEIAHKRDYRIDQALHLSEVARLHIATVAWQVRAGVRDALLTVYAARRRTDLLARKADAERQIVAMVGKRRAVGEGSGPDVDLAELAAAQTESSLASSRGIERDALARVATAIGVPVSALEGIHLDLKAFGAPLPEPPDEKTRREAVFHRSDLLASLARYAAAESALQLEIAKQYPDIHLGPGYTYDTGTNKFLFGLVGITLPIFDRNQGGIALAEARRKEAAARTAALQDTILGQVARALAHYRTSIDAAHASDKSLPVARQRLESQVASFAAGGTDRLALEQARAAYQDSQLTQLSASVAARRAAGALEDALQHRLTPSAAPVAQARRWSGS